MSSWAMHSLSAGKTYSYEKRQRLRPYCSRYLDDAQQSQVEPNRQYDSSGRIIAIILIKKSSSEVLRQQRQPPQKPTHPQLLNSQRHQLVGLRTQDRHCCWVQCVLCCHQAQLQVVLPVQWHPGVRISEIRSSGVLCDILGYQDR